MWFALRRRNTGALIVGCQTQTSSTGRTQHKTSDEVGASASAPFGNDASPLDEPNGYVCELAGQSLQHLALSWVECVASLT